MSGIGRIGLALSGGGYRAAAFHLGALDLLHRAGLAESVGGLSTVSGGTITGAAWALSRARGEPFKDFHARLRGWLERTNVVDRAIEALEGPPPATPAGRRSLICAAASVYAGADLFGDARFAQARAAPIGDLVFNTTEFCQGIDFRFQTRGVVGNGKFPIAAAAIDGARLADIIAASSCFPGAFEPIGFPDDFVWQGAAPPTMPAGFSLMDGGIYDNQGTEALLLANERGAGLDTLLICDTDQKDEEFFFRPSTQPPRGIRLGMVWRLTQAAWAMTALGAAMLSIELFAGRIELALPWLLLTALAVASPLTYLWIRRKVRAAYPALAPLLWRLLRSLRISEAIGFVANRGASLFALAAKVFMKRVRTLGYDKLYRDAEYENRRIAALIYTLRDAAEGPDAPSAEQRAVSVRAHQMPTTLWFETPDQLRDLVACGQNTVCYRLLHLALGRDQALEKRLRPIWTALQSDPYALFDPSAATPAGETLAASG